MVWIHGGGPFGEDGQWVARPRQQAEQAGVKFAKSLNCSTLSLAPGDIKPVDFAAEHQCGFWDALEQSH
ncbi:hypothetical protein [Actinocrispum wychmicini]|uniref:Alpha/beta hydrolase family protein n=1 Tax=Actinocrispum wychmicini TaxID=1213861 RepID=A0A4V2S6G5_9PSEU|nr:hypothetical protein [Actinocrispum wychmicini]TCO55980.1 hypothetical protein EV192_107405 [Actinocrispum wychmicini]